MRVLELELRVRLCLREPFILSLLVSVGQAQDADCTEDQADDDDQGQSGEEPAHQIFDFLLFSLAQFEGGNLFIATSL